MKLTDLAIQKLKAPAKGQKTHFEDGGFGVRVSQGGTKTFVLVQGKERKWSTIGRYPDMSLKEARQEALKIQVAPKASSAPKTAQEAISDFLAASEDRNRPATTANYRLYLDRITKTKLDDITLADITKTPHGIMAAKVFFNYCLRQRWVDRNPFQFEKVKLGQRSRLLTDDEIKKIWYHEHKPYTDHIKLLILTGQRRSQFSQFSIKGDTVFFPADVMKGKKDHTIPITPTIKALLEKLEPFNGWSKAKAKMDKEIKIDPWVIHDIRRYFSSTMAKLRTPLHVTERIIDHRSGSISGVAAIYNLHDFMDEAVEAVDKFEKHIMKVIK